MLQEVIALIEGETGISVTAETRMDALRLDSLEFLELLLEIERTFGIPTEISVKFETVGEIAA